VIRWWDKECIENSGRENKSEEKLRASEVDKIGTALCPMVGLIISSSELYRITVTIQSNSVVIS
jgi:hypothetical protein